MTDEQYNRAVQIHERLDELQLMNASIYAIEAVFNAWISGKRKRPKTMKAVVYDQFHWHQPDHVERYVEGTRQEILDQYDFYKTVHPKDSLGLVAEEYFKQLKESLNFENGRNDLCKKTLTSPTRN